MLAGAAPSPAPARVPTGQPLPRATPQASAAACPLSPKQQRAAATSTSSIVLPAGESTQLAHTCFFPNCGKPVEPDKDGLYSYWCSPEHRSMARSFLDPTVLPLTSRHRAFYLVVDRVLKLWLQPEFPMPPITAVSELYNKDRFLKWCHYLETRKGSRENRVHSLFIPTSVRCGLGASPRSCSPCDDPHCEACSVINKGIRSDDPDFGRIEFNATASSAYFRSKAPSGGRRAVFMCNVVVGQVWLWEGNEGKATCAPSGSDSVVGMRRVGGLFDDIAVYRRRAIDINYLVVF
eukprot:m51a1_g13061 hypothetical protein (292) ;mRNA; r:1787-2855